MGITVLAGVRMLTAVKTGKARSVQRRSRLASPMAKTVANGEESFTFPEKAMPLYTIVAKSISKAGEPPKFMGEASLWGYRGCNLTVNMVSVDNAISLEGKVISPEGNPMPGCLVRVDPGGYGAPEYATWPVHITFTDSSGRWLIDKIRPPVKWAVKKFLESPKMIGQPPLVNESLVAGILVKGGIDYKRFTGLLVPLITANMQHKLGDIVKHTTVQLPVSTNNVIYVGDIVLPEKSENKD